MKELVADDALAAHYQVPREHSWVLAAAECDIPVFVPGWEDSTLGNVDPRDGIGVGNGLRRGFFQWDRVGRFTPTGIYRAKHPQRTARERAGFYRLCCGVKPL